MGSKLEPLKRVVTIQRKHLAGHSTTSKTASPTPSRKSFNSRIPAIKAAARGFRRFANYRT